METKNAFVREWMCPEERQTWMMGLLAYKRFRDENWIFFEERVHILRPLSKNERENGQHGRLMSVPCWSLNPYTHTHTLCVFQKRFSHAFVKTDFHVRLCKQWKSWNLIIDSCTKLLHAVWLAYAENCKLVRYKFTWFE